MTSQWFRFSFSGENRLPNPYRIGVSCYCDIDRHELEKGKYVSNWNQYSCVRSDSIEDDGEPEDVIFDYSVPIVSSRLKNAILLNRVGLDDIQLLPIRLVKSTGIEIDGYSVLNVVRRIPALNRKLSFEISEHEHEVDPETRLRKIDAIYKIAINPDVVIGHNVFRLSEYNSALLMSSEFCKVFSHYNYTGYRLSQVLTSPPVIVTRMPGGNE